MAIIQQYPKKTPKSNDSVIGTSVPDPNTNDDPKTVNFPISGISTLIAAEIPQGPAGPAGANGAPGANGTNGTNGTNGIDGQDGAQGVAGADGTSINILGTVANCSGLPTSGNTSGDLYVLDADDAGCSYGAGTAGDGYVWTSGNTWLNIGPLRGPQGIQGVQGAQGPAGADGVDGTNGTNGAPGATGQQGPQGIQGPTGPSGGVTSVTAGSNISVTPLSIGDVTVSAPNAIVNTGDTFTSTPKVREIISLTSAEYAALQVINTTTLYVII